MNMAGTFADSRPVAQHCAELTSRGARPEERTEQIASWCRELALELASELGQLFSAGKLHVTVSEPEMLAGHKVFEKIGPVAVNCLLRCGARGQTALLSLDYATAIALTDCSFGGEGNTPDQIPSQLPRSAAMLVEQFASMIAQVITLTNGSAERKWGDVLVRSESVTRLKPFGPEAKIALFRLTLAQGAFAEWEAWLAVESERLHELLPGVETGGSSARSSGPSDGTTGPFAGMPMRVDAILSAFELSLGQLEKIKPGDEIPIIIPRELPLLIDAQPLAHGQIGSVDNRMALRVTRMERST
ncbi:MAG: FliM/FliN family flagellar motor switch protein [Pseudomonadota bacterium]